ncbi:MAG: hypothetical protein K8R35_01820 [Bacteroidales bacterium]|nr:hypothetical protein [Bacteroidales bacterium]
MSELSSKILKILMWVLMVVTIIFALIFYLGNVVPGTEGTRIEEPTITQSFLLWAYILFFVTAGITVIFSIINFIVNPKGGKKAIFALLGAVVVIVIAFLLADDTVLNMPYYDGKDNIPGTLKFVDTMLFTTYAMAGLACLSIVYSSVSKFFKK